MFDNKVMRQIKIVRGIARISPKCYTSGVKTNEIHLTTFFKPEDVLPHCGDMSYEKIVRTLATGLATRYNLPGGESLANEVLAREKIGTTVLMEGLSVPHARVEGLDRPYVAIATSARGIQWPGEDSDKVHIVFLILIPRDSPALYLKVLHVLGTILSDKETFNLVASMTSAGEIYRFFESGKAYLPRYLTAADIMRREYRSLLDRDTLQTCINALISEHTTELPVVDSDGNLKGVARADNLLRACIPEHFLWMDDISSILDFEPFVRVLDDEYRTPITTILSEACPTVSPDSPAVQIACEMMKHKSSKCYVRDGEKLVGVVKLTEFLNKIFRE